MSADVRTCISELRLLGSGDYAYAPLYEVWSTSVCMEYTWTMEYGVQRDSSTEFLSRTYDDVVLSLNPFWCSPDALIRALLPVILVRADVVIVAADLYDLPPIRSMYLWWDWSHPHQQSHTCVLGIGDFYAGSRGFRSKSRYTRHYETHL